MRKILLSPSAYYPSFGGVEEICRNLGAVLTELGFQVAIATHRNPDSLPEVESLHGMEVRRFDFYYPGRSTEHLSQSWRCIEGFFKFSRFIADWKPDLVHVICPSTNSLYCWAARSLSNFKLLVTFQGELFMDAQQFYDRTSIFPFGLRRLLSVADGITACSQYVLEDLHKKYNVPQQLQKVVFNGVDLAEIPIQKELSVHSRPFILGLGRLVSNKGFDVLIDAFSRIAEEIEDVDLIIVGEGETRPQLERLINEKVLESRVKLVGRKDRTEVAGYFNSCLFFVLPSPVEPFGIVCLEAMRAGKPVIATNTGGPPEFITPEIDGLLVKPSDPESLASAMKELAKNQQKLEQMSKAALLNVHKFDWKAITSQYIEIYNRLYAPQSVARTLFRG